MWQAHAAGHDARRRDRRHQITLTCTLVMDEHSVQCRTRDISYSGARIELPLPATSYDLTSLRSLHLRQIGFLRVEERWHSDRMVGLEFTNPQPFRASLMQLYLRSGIRDIR